MVAFAAKNCSPFPLYLAPFERYMHDDNRDDYPMAFVIQVRLAGEMDRPAFDTALRGALARHPLLTAHIKRRKRNKLCWVSAEGLLPHVDWADYDTPAANKAAYTFLSRDAASLVDGHELLASIRRETVAIKNNRQGERFGDALATAYWVKGLMPCLTALPQCMATAVLSNVGDPSRRFTARFPRRGGRIVCGNLTLEEITGVPPLRRKCRAAISAFAYNRRLTLSVRCDPFTFTADDTREFLGVYVARLRSYIAVQGEPLPLRRAA